MQERLLFSLSLFLFISVFLSVLCLCTTDNINNVLFHCYADNTLQYSIWRIDKSITEHNFEENLTENSIILYVTVVHSK